MENLHTILRCLYFIWVFLHDATLYWERKKFYCYSTSFFSYILHTKHKKANKNVISIPNHTTILSLKWVMHPSATISVMLYVCFNIWQLFSTSTFVVSTARCLFVTDYFFLHHILLLKGWIHLKRKVQPNKGLQYYTVGAVWSWWFKWFWWFYFIFFSGFFTFQNKSHLLQLFTRIMRLFFAPEISCRQ